MTGSFEGLSVDIVARDGNFQLSLLLSHLRKANELLLRYGRMNDNGLDKEKEWEKK
jgi:hypothetical protein